MTKKTILGVFLLMTGFNSTNAQISALDQEFFKTLFSDLVAYDSISASPDTGSAFNADQVAVMSFNFQLPAKIDTATIFDGGAVEKQYKGDWNGAAYDLYEYDVQSASTTKYKYYFNKDGRDSLVEVYIELSGWVQLHGFGWTYDSLGRPLNYTIISDPTSSGQLDTVVQMEYYYSSNKLDSVLQWDYQNSGMMGKILYTYAGAKIQKLSIYGDPNGNANLVLTSKLVPLYNENGKIDEIHEYFDHGSGLILDRAYRYNRSVNGNLTTNLKEVPDVDVYPNPCSEMLNISLPNTGKYELLDLHGNIIISGELKEGQSRIDIHKMASGPYILNLSFKEKTTCRLILKK